MTSDQSETLNKMEDKHQVSDANRVFQLEAYGLDKELNNTIDRCIDELDLTNFSDEIKTLLKLYLHISYLKQNATAGMQVYKLKFSDISTNKFERAKPSRHKLAALTVCNLVGFYALNKGQQLDHLFETSFFKKLNLPWLKSDSVSQIFKMLSVLNFMIFLGSGKYPTIKERLFGIGSIISDQDYNSSLAINRIQADFMYRETIWKVLADFLTAVIPLVNPTRVKNYALRFIGCMPKMDKEVSVMEKIKRESNNYKCAICEKQPFNPFVIGCRHVFCYYCLYSNYLVDPEGGFICSHCKYSTHDESDVQRYRRVLSR